MQPQVNKIENELYSIIVDFEDLSRKLYFGLKGHFNLKEISLLRAFRKGIVLQNGDFMLEGIVVNFSMHGIGCFFKSEFYEIDVEYGGNEVIGGFDYYRILDFINGNKLKKYELTEAQLKEAFNSLIEKEVILKSQNSPLEHLYFLITLPEQISPPAPK